MRTGHRILVVDDNDALRENIAEALELEGYQVVAVAGGQAALEQLACDPLPGLVLIDVKMPGMGGPELVSRLRRDPRLAALPVVLVSGLPPALDGLQVQAVLGKPFGVADLLAVVRPLLGLDHAGRAQPEASPAGPPGGPPTSPR